MGFTNSHVTRLLVNKLLTFPARLLVPKLFMYKSTSHMFNNKLHNNRLCKKLLPYVTNYWMSQIATDNSWSMSLKIQHFSCFIDRLSYVCDTFKTYGKQIFIHLIIVIDNIKGILVQLNQLELMVCGECDASYAQSVCTVLILSAVYGIGPTVAYMWRSLVNMLNYWYQLSFLPLMYSFVVDLPLKVYVKIFYRAFVKTHLVFHAQTYKPTGVRAGFLNLSVKQVLTAHFQG